MAEGDTAALVVALSAQITKFEKDMKQAVDVARKRTQEIESTFAGVNKAIGAQLNLLTSTFSARAGNVGTVLTSFGRAGVLAAAGIGAAVLAIGAAATVAAEFAEQADKLEQSAENLGVTITQMKALGIAGEVANQSFERTEQAFIKFVGSIEALRDAQGPLYEALRKTDKQLLLQLTNAKDTAEAIDILVKAFAKLQTQSEKVDLARAAGFTRGGVGTLEELAKSGGVTGSAATLKNIDESTKRLAEFKKELEKIRREAFDLIGEFITTKGLDFLKTTVNEFKAIGAVFESVAAAIERIRQSNSTQTSTNAEFANVPVMVPLPPARPPPPEAKQRATAAQVLDDIKRANTAMGDAVTLTQQLAQKQAELNVAVEKGDITRTQANKAMEVTNNAQKIAIATTLERLGVADLEIIKAGKLAEIEAAKAKGLITSEQAIKATTLAMKEANEEAEKLAVRRALLPGLKQLEFDAGNATKALDHFATTSLKSLEDGLVDVISGTKKLSEAFKQMVDSILKELLRLLLRQTVIAPLAGLLQGAAGTTGFGLQARQHGGPVKAGKLYKVGEAGMEYFIPHVDGQIVPKVEAPPGIKSTGASGDLNVIVENHGADVQQGERRRNASGGFDLRIAVRSIVQESFADSSMDSSMQRFGARSRSVIR